MTKDVGPAGGTGSDWDAIMIRRRSCNSGRPTEEEEAAVRRGRPPLVAEGLEALEAVIDEVGEAESVGDGAFADVFGFGDARPGDEGGAGEKIGVVVDGDEAKRGAGAAGAPGAEDDILRS